MDSPAILLQRFSLSLEESSAMAADDIIIVTNKRACMPTDFSSSVANNF